MKKCYSFGSQTTFKGLLLILSLVLNCPGSFAQETDTKDTLTSKRGTKIYIKADHSDRMKIIGQAFFLNMDCGTGDAMRLGVGVEGDYFLPELLSVHLAYTHSYLDIQKTDAGQLNKGANAVSGYSLF
jgi:hypothetical protein